jgi:hypothetical protein
MQETRLLGTENTNLGQDRVSLRRSS